MSHCTSLSAGAPVATVGLWLDADAAVPHRTGHSRYINLWTLHMHLRSNFVSRPEFPITEHYVSNAQTKLPAPQVRLF